MKIRPNWKAIIPIDTMLCAGLIMGFWFINKPLLLESLPVNFDWLAIYISNLVLVLAFICFPLIQYYQLKTVFSESGVSTKNIFGNKLYKWEDLSAVEINLYAIDLIFYNNKVQLLPYLFENRIEIFDYLKKKGKRGR